MRLFISYSSKDRDIAEQLYLALIAEKHVVFFDKSSLPPGGDYNARISKAINQCDKLIFLISPDSIIETAYSLSELKFAQNRWKHPKNNILPVMVKKTDYAYIPNYLKAVTIMEPTGNIAAEVVEEIKTQFLRKSIIFSYLLLIFILLSVLMIGLYFDELKKMRLLILNSSGLSVSDVPDKLPLQAPMLKTKLIFSISDRCPEKINIVAEKLQEKFVGEEPPIEIEKRIFSMKDLMENHQEIKRDIDILIESECLEDSPVVYFSSFSSRGVSEVYNMPLSMKLTDPHEDQLLRVSYALGKYLQRDYFEAAKSFKAADLFPAEPETRSFLNFLEGNSLLFLREYNKAINSYDMAIQNNPKSSRVYHNKGVAQMNLAWDNTEFDSAVKSFDKALQLSSSDKLPLVLKGQIGIWLSNVEQSDTYLYESKQFCSQAIDSTESIVVSQANVCLASIKVAQAYRGDVDMNVLTFEDERHLQELATPYWSMPLFVIGAVDFMRWQKMDDTLSKDSAKKKLSRALQESLDDVHLKSSITYFEAARYNYSQLMY